MTPSRIYLAALAFLCVIMASVLGIRKAAAAPTCGERPFVIGQLTDKYGETRRSMGLAANNGVVEVFASAVTGSWTIILTMPNGLTCFVATGSSFETLTEALPPQGIPG